MPEPEQGATSTWSLDDVSDDDLMARLKRLPQFAHIFAPPPLADPAKTQHYGAPKEDGPTIAEAIKSALSELRAKDATPSAPPTPPVVERVIEQAKSWFIDD